MTSKTFEVPNIGCAGCVAAITNELSDISGVHAVNGDVASKSVRIEFEAPATLRSIAAALADIGYPAESR